AQGSIVAHGQGVTLGQPVRDAFAIVHINDGEDVNVQSGRGIYTDAFGNAIVPSLTAYRLPTQHPHGKHAGTQRY
ncbi:fimbria/pilus outer membrane usher protein, partial [Enterobacter kobei]